MPRTITIAAVQMDASPAPTAERLGRASRLVSAAAGDGAQLIVLPELFNTGYTYADANHHRAEPLDDQTVTWMKGAAARLNAHLAGSLMLLDQDEIYNALLLFAPDGRMWRYDKLYPWGWERGYFRPGRGITVAETDLGHVGMMICWDTAHPRLWRRYVGRVDLMVISSCPPDVSNPTFHFPNGDTLTFDRMGPILASMQGNGPLVFGDMIDRQAGWLGVPCVNTVGSGHLRTAIPNGLGSFLTFLPLAPWLLRYLPQAGHMHMSSEYIAGCKVVDASGQVLAALTQEQGETFAVAQVTLAEKRPRPQGPQPASSVPFLTYLSSDILLPGLTIPIYRQGVRRILEIEKP